MPFPREFYIPKGARKVAMKDGGATFYLYETAAGAPYALAFFGKALKPAWHFRFKSENQRAKRIESAIASVRASAKAKADRKAEKAAAAAKGHGWEPGLILVSSWGYEQTNVDFFEVVECIGKSMVRVEKIGSQTATDDTGGGSSMSCYVVPDLKGRTGDFLRCKVSDGRIKVSSCSSAYPWDGLKRYCSWYA